MNQPRSPWYTQLTLRADAGTGMTATNSVAPRTGNVSAGTSTFAMIVLEKKLRKVYREIDMVTTPTGFPCAMSHANNGTSDLNAWVGLFGEFAELMGIQTSTRELFEKLYTESLKGDPICGGLLAYGYYSGENITMLNEGRLTVDRRVASMKNGTASYEKALSRIGIEVNTDGTLSLDKDTFMKADVSKVKSLFNGSGSYGYQVSSQASMINYAADNAVRKGSSYGINGAYSSGFSNGNLFNNYF